MRLRVLPRDDLVALGHDRVVVLARAFGDGAATATAGRELGQVHARAERLVAGAGEDDRVHGVVGLELGERLGERA